MQKKPERVFRPKTRIWHSHRTRGTHSQCYLPWSSSAPCSPLSHTTLQVWILERNSQTTRDTQAARLFLWVTYVIQRWTAAGYLPWPRSSTGRKWSYYWRLDQERRTDLGKLWRILLSLNRARIIKLELCRCLLDRHIWCDLCNMFTFVLMYLVANAVLNVFV